MLASRSDLEQLNRVEARILFDILILVGGAFVGR